MISSLASTLEFDGTPPPLIVRSARAVMDVSLSDDRPDSRDAEEVRLTHLVRLDTDRGVRLKLPVRRVLDRRVNHGISGVDGDRHDGSVRRLTCLWMLGRLVLRFGFGHGKLLFRGNTRS